MRIESNAQAAGEADEGAIQSGQAQTEYNTADQKTNSPKPDLSEARRLVSAGMKLVRLHDNTKQPIGEESNKHAVKAIDPKATGYGLPLVVNNLCSIDPDHLEMPGHRHLPDQRSLGGRIYVPVHRRRIRG